MESTVFDTLKRGCSPYDSFLLEDVGLQQMNSMANTEIKQNLKHFIF
jgi:hypothetical protein